jgi:hypothetical protein
MSRGGRYNTNFNERQGPAPETEIQPNHVGLMKVKPEDCKTCIYGKDEGIFHNQQLCAPGIKEERNLDTFKFIRSGM